MILYILANPKESNVKYFYITSIISSQKLIVEKLLAFSYGLYHTTIKLVESYVVVNWKFNNPKFFILWYDRLGHSRSSMMHQIIEYSHWHPLKNHKVLLSNEYSCVACSQGKLIVRPSFTKVISKPPIFLERIHEDICGPSHPSCGLLWYFMILIDVSTL